MFGLNWRIWKGLLFSAAVPALVSVPFFPFGAPAIFVMAFLIALVFGYPLFAFLAHYSLANLWTAVTIGFALGVLPGIIMFWPHDGLLSGIAVAVVFGTIGAFAGAAFWRKAIRESVETDTAGVE
jgi:hypothetical protein